ncbi:MAG: ATP-binding cassette, subfamily bacterial [Acidobacteriota bacterium]|jgi:ATP-binding cassette subfamily B protein|nr:ATP-binding cassette, subfamily bacterial [Acidobacteriota bacterium]
MSFRFAAGTRRAAGAESPTLRRRIAALRYIPPFVRLVWRTHRGLTFAMGVLRLSRAFVPVAVLWVGKLIIDAVVAARGGTPDAARLWRLVALEIALALVGETLSRASSVVESLLGDLFSNHTSVLLMEHAAQLDLYQFEDPEFYDRLDRARRQTTGRIGLLAQLLSMGQDSLTLLSLGAALLVYSPWLLLLLAVAVVPGFLGEAHYASLEYSLLFRRTPERRQLDYLRYLGASDQPAKEVQMFGLAPWLVGRYRTLSERFYEENKRLSIRRSIVAMLLSVVGLLGYYGAYAVILLRAVGGAITLGSLTFLAASFLRSRDLVQRLLSGASDIYSQCLYLKDLFDFFETKPAIASRPGAPPVPRPVRTGFVFENIGFRYPGSEAWALRGVSFHMRPGERLALVGGNGAGKTTLVKLLARLYDPTEGRILLDGRDLREYDLASVRRSVGVIFQDFIRYDLRFDENIGVGEIEEVRERLDALDAATDTATDAATNTATDAVTDVDETTSAGASLHDVSEGVLDGDAPAPIVAAARKSLAETLLPRLPGRYRQMLGRRFEGGVDLSGGEWQKVALARAYMRDAQVLILDEPTSALDARAEYEVFRRFADLMRGRMAVIISHRFSTVRMADRILVLDSGRVAEDGTHEHLVARGGLYAELFALQAEGYR